MSTSLADAALTPPAVAASAGAARLDYLDATRAFALVLGIVFHASLSFMPTYIGWAVQDISTGALVASFVTVSHAFRMEVFFLLAGYFSHLTFHRRGAGNFMKSRFVRIVVPFVLGWFLLRPLLTVAWVMGFTSMRGEVDIQAGIEAAVEMLKAVPAGLFTQTHLWFLYYIVLVTGLALIGRAVFGAVAGVRSDRWKRGLDAGVAWLASSPWGLPVLAAPTALALWHMSHWGMDTPDKSLQPHGPVLCIYGGFFCLGWLLDRQPAAMAALARLTPTRGLGAVVGLVGVLKLSDIQMDPGHAHHVIAHYGFVAAYALLMWSLVSLTIGVFKKCCSRPRGWVRYVADSSYWMYLIHLPIVIWLQVAIAEVPIHWSFKLGIVSAATIAIALISYDLVVRSTFIGAVLNGRRRNRVLGPWLVGQRGR
ncbi:acyltransferase family protein [Synoicihabitans lomoniglobus]|uniref:Acyltransferase family protein n=1 Tax=Synoicihabitans lomoniglobus TaxID=2909285 RepID=A0AAE9ZUM6_9BACT|nr:acyltransferase family protein [Opitutaceae bacterium LMO-M01]WED63369.1 acyltransferase family protein [Opitutaceae bacterium LMO-M01]